GELDVLLGLSVGVLTVLRLVGAAEFLDVVDVLLTVLKPRKRPSEGGALGPVQMLLYRGSGSRLGVQGGRSTRCTEHRPHRGFGDVGADLDTDPLRQLPAPHAGRGALGDVVIDRIGLAGFGGVALGDMLGEIDIAVPSIELVDGHHGTDYATSHL